jgi:DNA-binding transcriptional LysR family regulator
MSRPDLNLLVTLDVVLTEGSVARAARRLRLSPSAMSRALARLRSTVGDPLLVRSGRGLVPTPRALALRERVGPLVQEVEAILTPALAPDLARVERTFTVRASDGFVENFGSPLLRRLARQAPGVRLRFVQKTDGSSAMLREGEVDLETGVLSETTGPELRTQALFGDRLVGVVRRGHPLARGRITPARYAAALHVHVSRRGLDRGLVDEALRPLGLERRIVTVVTGFGAALALARNTDLVATVPERHTGNLRAGMHAFGLPVRTPEVTVSMLWHPRLDADPVHRWLRGCVREVCAARNLRGVRGQGTARRGPAAHSHSIVAGGLLEMS